MGEIRIEFKKDLPVYNSQEGGDMLTFERIRHAVMDYMPKDGIKKIYLFGSYARGNPSAGSDVDLHLITTKECSLLTVSSYRIDISKALGVDVDIVCNELPKENIYDKQFSEEIEKDKVLLYEA